MFSNRRSVSALVAALAGTFAITSAAAEPEYATMRLEIDIDRPVEEAWAKVGGYCDVEVWLGIACEITSGDGGLGSVRVLGDGIVTEVMIAESDFAYGYTVPPVEGEFYDLYHGFMEAKPVTESTSKVVYTLLYDVSDKPDQAAKEADLARRRAMFESSMENIKAVAEAD